MSPAKIRVSAVGATSDFSRRLLRSMHKMLVAQFSLNFSSEISIPTIGEAAGTSNMHAMSELEDEGGTCAPAGEIIARAEFARKEHINNSGCKHRNSDWGDVEESETVVSLFYKCAVGDEVWGGSYEGSHSACDARKCKRHH